MRLAILSLLVLLIGGCALGRRTLGQISRDRIIRVESGDRIFMTLAEPPEGCRWKSACDDPDVEVLLEGPTRTDVTVRIHRGYDGPSLVVFNCVNTRTGENMEERRVGLYRRVGDSAAWK